MSEMNHSSPSAPQSPAQPPTQSLAQRGNNRSRQPTNEAFRDFIGSGWGPRPSDPPRRSDAAPWAPASAWSSPPDLW